ncbi:S9 family peptidase [Ideonella sp. 4Y11]|uniref:S9 family peptidase n=1 Tax=Ideonella aquatica TaxID=2824119 RepID=A0A941BLN9_9BURK|nr:S9 family peptidase [Ideonella aquatica]MBQ0959909.1 S9 family peptidase [Ideonella aquatica]
MLHRALRAATLAASAALFTALPHVSAQAQSAAPAASPAPAQVPLIERARFFGNPSKVAGRISPDGRWLSWIAPRDGVLNIWVAPVNQPEQARALTAETSRPIRSYFWAPDSQRILFINDKGGDENFLLYGVPVAGGEPRLLTPFEKTRVQIVKISRERQDRILLGINNRDPRWHDIYSLDLASGQLSLVLRNEQGWAGFHADEQLVLRLAEKSRPDGGTDYHRVKDNQVDATALSSVSMEDSTTTGPRGFTPDGRTLYWTDSRGRNTAALVAQDLVTGSTRVVAEDPRADIGSVLTDLRDGRVLAWQVNYLTEEYVAKDPAVAADLAYLRGALKGSFTLTARTNADDRWVLAVDPVTAPSYTVLFDRQARRLTPLFVSRPELDGAPLVPMQALELKARDGLTMVSYLSLPKDADPPGSGRPAKPVPMVLLVHGGPWARDDHGYNSYHQWLANRGYAVLSVNFRGSTGFGKAFVSAGDLQWGRRMHDDLLDAVDWAVKNGITTREQVAIMGGSYGGYATLAGLTVTPTAFACGVDIVGPSNLFTLLESIPPYWESFRQQLYRRMGDPTTEAGKALLKERSPLTYADRIVRPLLIGQGANDPRVNVRESDQIVQAMAERNIPVTYVLFPDEGHGFARPVNAIAFNAVTENFLARCLGGRAEPIGDTLKASTAQVKHGAAYTPGVAQALPAGR